MARYWADTAQQFSLSLLPEPVPTAEKIQKYRAASRRLRQLIAVKAAPKVKVDPTPRREFIRIRHTYNVSTSTRAASAPLGSLSRLEVQRTTTGTFQNTTEVPQEGAENTVAKDLLQKVDDAINGSGRAGNPHADATTPVKAMDIRSRNCELRPPALATASQRHRSILFDEENEESLALSIDIRQPATKSRGPHSPKMARLRLSIVKSELNMAKLRQEQHNRWNHINGLQIIERTRSDILNMKRGMTASMCATFATKVWDACSLVQPIQAAKVRQEARACMRANQNWAKLKVLPPLRVNMPSSNQMDDV